MSQESQDANKKRQILASYEHKIPRWSKSPTFSNFQSFFLNRVHISLC
jgi:hypothetical protein